MLKIKDNVDLKELEKFGFKPRYDEKTGEIYRYIHPYYEMPIYIEGKYIYPEKQITKYNGVLEYYSQKFVEECIYDLIKADLVEKV